MDLFAALIVLFGVMCAATFAGRTVSRIPKPASERVLYGAIASIGLYAAALWGGQEMGLWDITSAWGRPALVLALAALAWLGIQRYGRI